MATELECMRSLLLTTMDVGLAIAVTDVVVVLEDVGICDAVGVELGSENVCGLPDDRHGIKRTREAQDLVGGGAAAAAAGPTAIVAVVRVGRCTTVVKGPRACWPAHSSSRM